jgi:hypothetical protein
MILRSSSSLRQDLSRRNLDRAQKHAHELTYGAVPSVIYREEQGSHGNFIPASYRSICARPEWQQRLRKSYTGGKWIPRSWERSRRELDCANSSDALLMNIFCYPKVLHRPQMCSLLGIEPGVPPEFGFRPRIPFLSARADRTEVDMRLGDILIEAKLTETSFPSASTRLLFRYRDLDEVFEVGELPIDGEMVPAYQLIRGVLAAHACGFSFVLLCDGRRADLIERWLEVMRAVRSYSFRNRLKLLTWQEVARALPKKLQQFLEEKYGIFAKPGMDIGHSPD